MPTKSPRSGTPPAAAADDHQTVRGPNPDQGPGSQDPDVTPRGGQPSAEQDASDFTVLPVGERIAAERTERRRQRMLARESSTTTGEPDTAGRRTAPTVSSSALTPPGRQPMSSALFVTVGVVLVAGAALGAVLGALSVTGWVIGLLVAAVTAILSTALRPPSRGGPARL